jgi:Tfp pilus assembly protein PilF
LFTIFTKYHNEMTQETSIFGVKSYSFEQTPTIVSFSPIYADGASHENTQLQILKNDALISDAMLERNEQNEENYIHLIGLLGIQEDQSHILLLLDRKFKGVDISKITRPPRGIRSEDVRKVREIGRGLVRTKSSPMAMRYDAIFEHLDKLNTEENYDGASFYCREELKSADVHESPILTATLQYELGELLFKQGNDAEAAEHLRSAVSLKAFQETSPECFVRAVEVLACLHKKIGKNDVAVDIYQRLAESGLIENKSDLARIYDNLGYLLEITGDDDKAVTAYRKAFRSIDYQDQENVGIRLAVLQRKMKKYADAAVTFEERAERIENTDPPDLAKLAATHADIGYAFADAGEQQKDVGGDSKVFREKAIPWLQKAFASDASNELRKKEHAKWKKAGKVLFRLQRHLKKRLDAAATSQDLAEKGTWTGAELADLHAEGGHELARGGEDENADEADRKAYREKAIERLQKAFRSDDFRKDHLDDWKGVGKELFSLQRATERFDDAADTMQELAEKGEFTAAQIAAMHAKIGYLFADAGDQQKAVGADPNAFRQKAVTWLQKAFGSDDFRKDKPNEWMTVGKRLSFLQRKMKNHLDAAATDQELAEKGIFTEPEELADLAQIHTHIGESLGKAGEYEKGIEWLQKSFGSDDFRKLRYLKWKNTGKRLSSLQRKMKQYPAAVNTNYKILDKYEFTDAEALVDAAAIQADIGDLLAEAMDVEKNDKKADAIGADAIQSLQNAFGNDYYQDSRHKEWKNAGKLLSYLQRKMKQPEASVITDQKLDEKGKFTAPEELAELAEIHLHIGYALTDIGDDEKAIEWLHKTFDSDDCRELRHTEWKHGGKLLSYLQRNAQQCNAAIATNQKLANEGEFTVAELAAIHAEIDELRAEAGGVGSSSSQARVASPGAPTQGIATPHSGAMQVAVIDATPNIYRDDNPFGNQNLTVGLRDLRDILTRWIPRAAPAHRDADSGSGSGDDYIPGVTVIQRESAEAIESFRNDPLTAAHLEALRASRPIIRSDRPPLPPQPHSSSHGPRSQSPAHERS